METKNVLRDIRVLLRLAMNGVVATSMREKGVVYKLNFGVSLPKIKEIASNYKKNAVLADALWGEEVREMKILATLLQPINEFSYDKAQAWAKEVKHLEIAELYCLNLLQEVSFADRLVLQWVKAVDGYLPTMGYLLFARLCANNIGLAQNTSAFVLSEAKKSLEGDSSRLKAPALLALKRYGRANKENAATVLALVSNYKDDSSAEKQEYLNDLEFEFDYYQHGLQ